MDSALIQFNKLNKTYSSKAPNTAIIQKAIGGQIQDLIKEDLLPYYRKLALKTARKSISV
jgi:hypothetical protein